MYDLELFFGWVECNSAIATPFVDDALAPLHLRHDLCVALLAERALACHIVGEQILAAIRRQPLQLATATGQSVPALVGE